MNNNYIKYLTATKYKNKYYLTAENYDALFEFDIESKKTSYVKSFNCNKNIDCLYIKSLCYNDEIWFIPCYANEIAIFNVISKEISYIDIPGAVHVKTDETKYNDFIWCGENHICLVPRKMNDALIINLKEKRIEKKYTIATELEKYHSAFFLNDKIYIYPWKGDRRAIIDLKQDKVDFDRWENDEVYGCVVYASSVDKVFHAPLKTNIILVDNINREFVEKITVDQLSGDDINSFFASCDDNNIFFWGIDKVMVFDCLNSKCDIIEFDNICPEKYRFFYPIDTSGVAALWCGENKIYNYNKKDCILLDFDKNRLLNELKEHNIDYSDIIINKTDNLYLEKYEINLCDFISSLI